MRDLVKRLLRRASPVQAERLLHHFTYLLRREIADPAGTLLDVGCGYESPVRVFTGRLRRVVGVDRHLPYLERSRAAGHHDEYRVADALAIGEEFGPDSFDCVAALDLIEHLTKEEGHRLISAMESVARSKVVIFTPNGFLPQTEYDGNPLQEHRSGWTADEFRRLGYRVVGVHGWRPLRGERGTLRWRPRWLWGPVSVVSQLWTESRPDAAFQLLCVKELEGGGPAAGRGEGAS